jgi:hypothetical protein
VQSGFRRRVGVRLHSRGDLSIDTSDLFKAIHRQFSILAIYSQSGRNETHVDDPPDPTAFSTFFQEGHQLLTEREYSLDVERHELCERLVRVGLEGFAPCGSRVVDQDVENCRPWRGGGKRCQRRDLGQEEEASGLPFSRRPISSASLTQSSYLKPAASRVSLPHPRIPSYATLDSLAQVSDDGDTFPLPELVQLVGRLLQSARGSRRDVDFGAVLDVARGDLSALHSGIISSRSGMMTREQI